MNQNVKPHKYSNSARLHTALNNTKFLVRLHAISVEYSIQNKADVSVHLAYAEEQNREYTDGQCIILDVSLTKALR